MSSAAFKYHCGTPAADCSGSAATLSGALAGRGIKTHNSPAEAFDCHAAHLAKQGYTRIDSRAYAPPGGGPVRVLTKRSRFGGKLRKGKGAEKGAKSSRHMPSRPRTGGMVSSL